MIPRYYDKLSNYVEKGKVLLIYGPRRSGKTTLLKNYLSNLDGVNYRFDVGDDIRIQNVLGSRDLKKITEYAEGYDMVVIDEAQYIPNIGAGLKLLVDQRQDLKIIATGSSSFDLREEVGEPLTGRYRLISLYPIAQLELRQRLNNFDLKNNLEDYLIFGSYPEILQDKNKSIARKKEYLNRIVNSYLLKDVLSLSGIKAPKKLFNLLELIAFQVGNEVVHSELSQKLGMSVKTVSHYLDILEKMFVLVNIRGFSRNLRKEITRKSMYYFYDNGIRNAIISNFNFLNKRNDIGPLWENFIISERIKKQSYKKIYANNYFWRTYDQKEIDWVEKRGSKLFAYEIKWSKDQKPKPPKDFIETYNNAEFQIINKDNYLDFIT